MPNLSPMLPRPFRISRVQRETVDTFTWELQAQDSATDFNFSPGQFNMLYVFGKGEVPISISGNPMEPKMLTHTIRAVGSVTAAMRGLKRGGILGLRGPYGSKWPLALGKDIVVLAGGLGLAPLRPIIYHVLSNRQRYGRLTVLYGARTPSDVLYRHELEKWRARFDVDVGVIVANADSQWRGNVGWITELIQQVKVDPPSARAFVCGPELMMRASARELGRLGLSDDEIFVSLERNMKCAVGFCGHCMFGPTFVCKDGPVFPYSRVRELLQVREL